ncbi:hypothetical protein Tco_0989103 [Tanacetum coccineum]|uniref:Uncharacterized protein n=1 Tax=Tanacetum coccineum TaxID=301880 RepID=A0ABQ5ESX2_9ASTR
MKIEESVNVTFIETPPPSKTSPLVDDDLDEEEAIKVTKKKNLEKDIEDETLEIDEVVNIKESKNHLLEKEPKNVNEALKDERTKWEYRNKLDENVVVSRNKARSRKNIEDVVKQRVQGLRSNGAFRRVGDEEVVVGEGVVVTSSSLKMLINSYLGGIMVSLIFLEGLQEEALVEFMVEFS